jgi:hypothetical protein
MRMTLVTHTDFLLTPLIALLLCTPKYIEGMMTLGEVVQAAAAFVVVQGAFNWGYRQLWAHRRVGRFSEPRGVAAAGAGPDRRADKSRRHRGSRHQ